MVRPSKVAASATTANRSRPNLSQIRRSRTSGSFHAGEPFPLPSPYDETPSSSSRPQRPPTADPRLLLLRQSTPKSLTCPPPPPDAPSDGQRSPGEPRAWYKR